MPLTRSLELCTQLSAAATNEHYSAVQPGSPSSGSPSNQPTYQLQHQVRYQIQNQPSQYHFQTMGSSDESAKQQQQGMVAAASNLESSGTSAPSGDLISQSSSISTSALKQQSASGESSASSNGADFMSLSSSNLHDSSNPGSQSAKLQATPSQSAESNKLPQAVSSLTGGSSSSISNLASLSASEPSHGQQQALALALSRHNQQQGKFSSANLLGTLNELGHEHHQPGLKSHRHLLNHKQLASQSPSSLFSSRHMMLAQADTVHPYSSIESLSGNPDSQQQQQQQLALQSAMADHQQQNHHLMMQQQQQQQNYTQGKTLLNQLTRFWSIVGRNKSLLPGISPFSNKSNTNQRHYQQQSVAAQIPGTANEGI